MASSATMPERIVGDARDRRACRHRGARDVGVPAGKTVSMCALSAMKGALGSTAGPNAEDVAQLVAMHVGQAEP